MEFLDVLVVIESQGSREQIKYVTAAEAIELFPLYACMIGSGSVIRAQRISAAEIKVMPGGILNFDGILFRTHWSPSCLYIYNEGMQKFIPHVGVVLN